MATGITHFDQPLTEVTVPPRTRTVLPTNFTMAQLQEHLGGIPAERIRIFPAPGTATEEDALAVEAETGLGCELIDGVLVLKAHGFPESLVSTDLASELYGLVKQMNLGIVVGGDLMYEMLPHQVRMPDVSFTSWARFPDKRVPNDPLPAMAPDLAVHVLKPGNVPDEMARRLQDYFRAGVRLVWYVDAHARKAKCYTAENELTEIDEAGALTGGDVLPGLELSFAKAFGQADQLKQHTA